MKNIKALFTTGIFSNVNSQAAEAIETEDDLVKFLEDNSNVIANSLKKAVINEDWETLSKVLLTFCTGYSLPAVEWIYDKYGAGELIERSWRFVVNAIENNERGTARGIKEFYNLLKFIKSLIIEGIGIKEEEANPETGKYLFAFTKKPEEVYPAIKKFTKDFIEKGEVYGLNGFFVSFLSIAEFFEEDMDSIATCMTEYLDKFEKFVTLIPPEVNIEDIETVKEAFKRFAQEEGILNYKDHLLKKYTELQVQMNVIEAMYKDKFGEDLVIEDDYDWDDEEIED